MGASGPYEVQAKFVWTNGPFASFSVKFVWTNGAESSSKGFRIFLGYFRHQKVILIFGLVYNNLKNPENPDLAN